jgi:hypothetical protein
MGAWRSYCSREKEHEDGGSVDRMQQLWVHGELSSREKEHEDGGSVDRMQQFWVHGELSSREKEHEDVGSVDRMTGEELLHVQEGRSITCKRKELLQVVGSHCSTEKLLQERSVTTGGRINTLLEEGVSACRRGDYCRRDSYCIGVEL